jgi:hypothetical protein
MTAADPYNYFSVYSLQKIRQTNALMWLVVRRSPTKTDKDKSKDKIRLITYHEGTENG